jgi:hypothetical protein
MIRQYVSVCDYLTTQSLRFLVSKAQKGGFAPFEGGHPNAMTTAEVVSAMIETGASFPSDLIRKAINRLVMWQLADGSWTDPNSKDPWDVSTTAWAIWALWGFSASMHQERCRQAVRWLEVQMDSDGGFPTNSHQRTPNTYATGYAYRSLYALGTRRATSLAVNFLSRVQNSDGGWGLSVGDNSEATLTAYVLHGLIDGQFPFSKLIRRGLSFLNRVRDTQGLWGSWLNEAQSVEGTAFCLYVRSRVIPRVNRLDFAGLQYIAQRINEGSAWKIGGKDQTWVAVSVLLVANQIRRNVMGR